MAERILRMKAVLDKLGVKSPNVVYEKLDQKSKRFDPSFPHPIHYGPNGYSIGFLESEIDSWIAARVAERDAKLSPMGKPARTLSSRTGGQDTPTGHPTQSVSSIDRVHVPPGAGPGGDVTSGASPPTPIFIPT